MATPTAPIKVYPATDDLVSQAAHFLSRSKKDIVDAAVCEYIDVHRDEINAGVKVALGQLNGTDAAAVTLMTGLSNHRQRLATVLKMAPGPPKKGGPSTNLRSMRADGLEGSDHDSTACEGRKLSSQQAPARTSGLTHGDG